MHVKDVDLNLLRLFDAVFRARSVSRAAEMLGLTQPAASQGLTRLRALLHDPLFIRAPGGVQPTPKANRLAEPVRLALVGIEQALSETAAFEPAVAERTFHLHMSDSGEMRFLPALMAAVRREAPGVRLESRRMPREQITEALDNGLIDFAFGFLPTVKDTRRTELIRDNYVVLLREGHPLSAERRKGKALLAALKQLDFVGVRTHADTLRILQLLKLQDRLRLVTDHFTVLPAIVRATDLAAIMPGVIARGFDDGYALLEPDLPLRDFVVSLHWSRRFEIDPGNRWLRDLTVRLFA
ncbi:LysR family transcriptional regulator [Variovorax sp. VNK109]|jgi:DNA-binding transcriptional LysR family regulator|uniref:LysR family transcriptional regulator n=1 Tax=Variovorax sp. VNK109 TaxID=3400919 RepID=UPI003BFCF9DC